MTDIKDKSDFSLHRVLIYVGDGGHYLRQEGTGYTTAQNAGVFTREEASVLTATFGPEKRYELRKVPADHIPTLFAKLTTATARANEAEADRNAVIRTSNVLLSVAEGFQARVADLQGVVTEYYNNYMLDEAEDEAICADGKRQHLRAKAVGVALARTPAQSLARVQAEALRKMKKLCNPDWPVSAGPGYVTADQIEAYAVSLEAEAANGSFVTVAELRAVMKAVAENLQTASDRRDPDKS